MNDTVGDGLTLGWVPDTLSWCRRRQNYSGAELKGEITYQFLLQAQETQSAGRLTRGLLQGAHDPPLLWLLMVLFVLLGQYLSVNSQMNVEIIVGSRAPAFSSPSPETPLGALCTNVVPQT